MESKKVNKIFNMIILGVAVITLGLSVFYNNAFIPSFMLMMSLFFFGECYYIKDERKKLMYILFIVGILLVIGSLVYTFMRLV